MNLVWLDVVASFFSFVNVCVCGMFKLRDFVFVTSVYRNN